MALETAETQEKNLRDPNHEQAIKQQLTAAGTPAVAARSLVEWEDMAEMTELEEELGAHESETEAQVGRHLEADSAAGVGRSSTPGLDRLISGKLRLPRPFRCVL